VPAVPAGAARPLRPCAVVIALAQRCQAFCGILGGKRPSERRGGRQRSAEKTSGTSEKFA